ncbi:hypothetical protein Pelo_900 [Pelomyxa schiedti]|nr:hypothetical protein Pelo_900 [Pelomyxa schiedti]
MNKNAAIVFTENAVKPFVDVFNHTDYTFHSLDSESHLNILKSQILSVTSEISGSYGVPVWKAAVSAHLSTEMDLFKTRGEGAHTVVYCGAMKVVKATVSILQTSITLNSSIEDMLEKSLTLESDDAKRGALHHVFTTVGYFVALDFKIGGLLFGSQAAEKYATTEDKVTKFVTNFRGAVSAVLEVLTGNASVGAKGGVKNSLDSTDLTSAFSFKWHSLGGSCLNDITRPTGWAKSVSDSWAVIECSNAVPIYKLSRNEALKTEIERLMRSAPPELITSHVQTRYHLKGDRGKSDYKDSEFTDDPSHAMRLHAVKIWYGTYIDSIQAVYQTPDGLVEGPRHGGTGGTPHIFTLGDEEFIVEVRGRAKEYLERLSFTTNRGSFKEFGQSGPDTCAVTLRPVVGFAGQYCYCKEVPYVLTALGFLCL